MAKKGKLYFVKDWKHWLGWALTTVAIVFFLVISGAILSWSEAGVIAGTVVVVDIIKHLTGLQ